MLLIYDYVNSTMVSKCLTASGVNHRFNHMYVHIHSVLTLADEQQVAVQLFYRHKLANWSFSS